MKTSRFFTQKLKFILLHLSFVIPAVAGFSQKYTLRGVLSDSLDAPLEAATVMLMNPKDSSLVAFGRSKTEGIFELKNVSAGRYLLRCTYLGYHPFQKMQEVGGENRLLDLGKISLVPNTRLLGEATISADASPVTLKKDTIEFRAASFKTQPNATVEDLLKKLPGVEVERDGTIRAQGEQVQNVLVEGKKFFGDDPKMATQNLPAEAVEKVQIYDQKSETATFTGVDDGQKEKTINLDLKEDHKNGWFGRLTGGAGGGPNLDTRYEGKASLNRFTPKSQISLLGIGNNVNQPGFSVDDYMQYTGAMRRMMGGGGGRVSLQFDSENMDVPLDFGNNEGFLRTGAGGVNLNRDFGPASRKGNLGGSYFFSNLGQNFDRTTTRQSFLPTGTFVTTGNSQQENLRESHRANFTIDQKIDSFNSVQLDAGYVRSATNSTSVSESKTLGPTGQRQNDGDRNYASEGTNNSLQSNLTFRHKFKKRGRNVALDGSFNLNRGDSESDVFSKNSFYGEGGGVLRTDTLNQNALSKNDATTFGAGATFTEPLGKKRYLEFRYNFNLTENQSDRSVYDLSGLGERRFNALLSNAFENRFGYHRAGAGMRLNRKTWSGSFGLDAQSARLEGEVLSGSGQPVSRNFEHLLPRAEFQKEMTNNRNLSLGYRTEVRPPSVQQLQPVPDVSDPLNIREGNAALRPEFSHNLDLHFNKFNPDNFRSFFVGLNASLTQDQIADAQWVDSNFVRRFQPRNAPLGYQIFGNIFTGLPLKKWHSRFNLRTEGRFFQTQNFLNDAQNDTRQTTLIQAVDWEFEWREWFWITTGADVRWNRATYSLDGQFDQSYFDQTYYTDGTLKLPKNFSINSSLNVAVNRGRAAGFNQTVPIWNASVSKFFGKKQRLELTLAARDLLNQNTGIRRDANLNFIQDERVASLARFFMLRATYALNSGGGGQGGPSFRMMIRR